MDKKGNEKIKNEKLPKAFDGYKIAQISDFHNTKSKRLQQQILKTLENDKPDILVITGDFIDSRRTNINISLNFIKQIKNIPIYYVAGNHESRIKEYKSFKEKLIELGVFVLENEKISIGLQDPSFETSENNSEEMKRIIDKYLKNFSSKENFEILLLHRPELLDVYAQNNVDLV